MGPPPIRVLLVDDHKVMVQGLTHVLGAEPDIEVVGTAGQVSHVLPAFRTLHPDVILMDYDLPDGNGITAARAVLDDDPEAKIVMLTSSTNDSVLVAAIELGCAGFITKHKAGDEVASAVRAAHRGGAVISPTMLARLLPKLGGRGGKRLGSDLTTREREVLQVLARGGSNSDVGAELFVSVHTVRHHVQNILTKLNAHSKLEAVTVGVREGIIPPL